MALTGQNHGVYGSKVWHFWVVTHGVLAEPDYKTTRLLLRKTTSQQDYETTRGAVAGGASQELWNYG